MEKSTIIRLRQDEASNVTSNGAYEVSLKEGVVLEEGDEVRVHSVILDTATESVINIEKNTRVRMKVVKYFRNYIASRPTAQTSNPAAVTTPDLKLYFASLRAASQGVNYLLQGIYMQTTSSDILAKFGGADTVWEYYDPSTGLKTRTHIKLPRISIVSHEYDAVYVPTTGGSDPDRKHGLITGGGQGRYFKLISPTVAELAKHPYRCEVNPTFNLPFIAAGASAPAKEDSAGLAWGNGGNPLSNTPDIITPYTENCEFDLAADTYTPAEIAQIANDTMSKLDSLGELGHTHGTSYPVNNPFLATLNQMFTKVAATTLPDGTVPTLIFSPASTPDALGPGQNIVTLVNPASNAEDALFGANQVSMNYDENLKKLNFDSLHMPFYISPTPTAAGSTTFVPGVSYPAAPIAQEPLISLGGAAFTSLESYELDTLGDGTKVVTDRTTNFWQQLGFTNLTLNIGHGSVPLTLDDGTDIFPLNITTTLGENITGALATIDGILNKSAAGNAAFPIVPFVGETENNFTTPILSNRTFDESDNDEGYYMIEVGVKMPQKLIGGFERVGGQTTSNAIQAIVGKFYTSGNFLQSQGEGIIAYTHVGEPQLVRDLSVRVLHPNFSLPTNEDLGNRNSIFLEIIKPVKVVQTATKV